MCSSLELEKLDFPSLLPWHGQNQVFDHLEFSSCLQKVIAPNSVSLEVGDWKSMKQLGDWLRRLSLDFFFLRFPSAVSFCILQPPFLYLKGRETWYSREGHVWKRCEGGTYSQNSCLPGHQCLQQVGLGVAEARSLELHWSLPCGWQDLNSWAIPAAFQGLLLWETRFGSYQPRNQTQTTISIVGFRHF